MQKQNLNEKSDDFGCHNSHSDSTGPVARLHCKSGSPTLHWSPKCNAVSFSPIGTGKENGHIITENPNQNVWDYWASRPNIEPPCGMQLGSECKNLNNPLSIAKIQSTPKSGEREFQKMHRHCLAIQTIIPDKIQNNTSL